jgi:transposase
VFQPPILHMVIWLEASNAQNNIAAVSVDGSTVCVMIRRLNSSCRRSIAVGLNLRVRQSGLGFAQHGRISKRGRSHAHAMLVEAAWAAAKTPGSLRAFFLRIRARRGHQIAAVRAA